MGFWEIVITLIAIGLILRGLRALVLGAAEGNILAILVILFLGTWLIASLESAVGLVLFIFVIGLSIKLIQQIKIEWFIRYFKSRKIENQNVCLEVQGQGLPFEGLGIFCRLDKAKKNVEIVFPFLDESGSLLFNFRWYDLLYVKVHSLQKGESNHSSYLLIQRVSPLVQNLLKLQQEDDKQEQEARRIKYLLTLVSTSGVYKSREQLYQRALYQLQQIRQKRRKLAVLYDSYVREFLIGKQLSDYDPSGINDNRIDLDTQYKALEEEYEKEKDEATAYTELLKTNQL